MLVVGLLARWLIPLHFLDPAFSMPIGLMITIASFSLFFWAVYTMWSGSASIPTGKPTNSIVLRGPFRFSRNPIYLSMVLLQVGIGIWANSLWFVGSAVIAAALLWWGVISREERYLERKFGAAYLSYKGRVRRWL
jgi:protein-S-isoprenylcysteine O-methyltransferase Ste14